MIHQALIHKSKTWLMWHCIKIGWRWCLLLSQFLIKVMCSTTRVDLKGLGCLWVIAVILWLISTVSISLSAFVSNTSFYFSLFLSFYSHLHPVTLSVVSCLCLFSIGPGCFSSKGEDRLFRKLFRRYNQFIRPVENVSDPVTVEFEVSISQLVKVVS